MVVLSAAWRLVIPGLRTGGWTFRFFRHNSSLKNFFLINGVIFNKDFCMSVSGFEYNSGDAHFQVIYNEKPEFF
jgi:hypothetical protein